MINDTDKAVTLEFPDAETAYAGAPSVIGEIGWVAEQAALRPIGVQLGREFWLRKAAVLDRIALNEVAEYSAEVAEDAVQAAASAALRLIEFDEQNHNDSGRSGPGSLRFWDPIVGAGRRAYVRQQYLSWSLSQGS
ncbi:hypothetical protein [Kitasatospora camelliae]|uniref:Head-to-tail adaptor n=1 Tax=Kitasatospora camelliae TaxID=3156397 RepID=A0AAU8K3Y1_9ACTN